MASNSIKCVLHLAVLLLVCLSFPSNTLSDSSPYTKPPPTPPQVAKVIAADGVIFCRCKLPGYRADLDAAPIAGVNVTLTCGNPKSTGLVSFNGFTTASGYFFVQNIVPQKKMTKTCQVTLTPPAGSKCTVPPAYANGIPAIFKKNLDEKPWKVALFTIGIKTIGPDHSSKCY